MNRQKKKEADTVFLVLASLFITALVTTNIIASKFVEVDLGFKVFQISAGILPYPITFLITDILSEVYGRAKTQKVVVAGFVSASFTLFILWLGAQFPAMDNSPIDQNTYQQVFGLAPRVIISSMLAYLVAQYIDVRLFHFWKGLTKGKYLWFRNNASTVVSQFVDSTLVVGVLFYDKMSISEMATLILASWLFKALVALSDTPFIYIAVYALQKRFGLKKHQEVP